jgi:hypothetical protein
MRSHDKLRSHLTRLLKWKDAHVDFDTAVKGVPPRFRGIQPPAVPYSLWQLLEHLRIAQRDILDFCRDPAYRAPTWPNDYWPPSPTPPDSRAWQRSIAAFRADRRSLQLLLADPGLDLYAKIPHGQGQTYLREFLLVADHNSFHIGQLVVVRRHLGIWG